MQPSTPADIPHAITDQQSLNNAIDKVVTQRVLINMSQDIKDGKMPPLIEIKGLGAAVQAAKAGIASVRFETAGLSSDAAALVSSLQSVRQQIQQAQSDLTFEAQTLGNGAPSSTNSEPQSQTSPTSGSST